MAEEKKITTADEYRKKTLRIKEVKLPSGAIFEIRAISVLDFLGDEKLPIASFTGNTAKDEAKIKKVIGDRDMREMMKPILIKGVYSPKLSEKPKEGELDLEIVLANYTDALFLVNEIMAMTTKAMQPFLSKSAKQNS